MNSYEGKKRARIERYKTYSENAKERIIDSSDPNACKKIASKIDHLIERAEQSKRFNARLRKYKTWDDLEVLTPDHKDHDLKAHVSSRMSYYAIPPTTSRSYYLNTSSYCAEVKRLRNRLNALKETAKIEDFSVGMHDVAIVDGRVQCTLAFIPCKESRTTLKSNPLSLKWSRYSQAWVRKLGPGTDKWFFDALKRTLKELEA